MYCPGTREARVPARRPAPAAHHGGAQLCPLRSLLRPAGAGQPDGVCDAGQVPQAAGQHLRSRPDNALLRLPRGGAEDDDLLPAGAHCGAHSKRTTP